MPVSDSALELTAQQVEELVRNMAKALRAFQMYLPNNPIYQRAIEGLRAAFNPIWASVPRLSLTVAETDLLWEEQVVHHQAQRSDSFAWLMYKDGLRQITFTPGVEDEEIATFLQTVVRARLLAADAGDDLLTLLWEHDFHFIEYRFAEIITDTLAVMDPHLGDLGMATDPYRQAEMQHKVREDLGSPGPLNESDDFDSTLYFLDEAEIESLREQVEQEYQRDLRTVALAGLMDVFELHAAAEVRNEVLAILESVFPNFLNRGEFRVVGWILRELRLIGSRVAVIDDATRAKLDSFEARLSEPALLAQLLQVVDEAVGLVEDADLTELLRELRAPALEPLLAHLHGVRDPRVRQILEAAADRIARGHLDELTRILRSPKSPALVQAAVLCRRVTFPAAAAAVGELIEHADPAVRLAAVETLGALGTVGALGLLEPAIEDPDRAVRLAAVGVVGARGFKGALKRLEAAVRGRAPHELERSEKRQFFEAYAAVAGPGGLDLLTRVLEPGGLFRKRESAETRTCAAYAVARIRTDAARQVLERAAEDKELSVRNAAARALREWET